MNKTLLLPDVIVTADTQDRVLRKHFVLVEDGAITAMGEYLPEEWKKFSGQVVTLQGKTLIPGFVQTHVHLCQTLFRGLADDLELLDWLQKRIFPCEHAHDAASLRASAQLGIYELTMGGTTTVLDMGTLNHQEVIFDELIASGMRAVAGKCMIDENELYPIFKSTTKKELSTTYELAKTYHNFDGGRIRYGFAPRFVLSCSENLLKQTKAMMADFEGSILHTHSSENKGEIAEVRRRHNKENIDYFNSISLLDDSTVLAHCVHANDKEVNLLKKTGTRVAHCPSSNLKLASGIAPVARYLKEGVHVSLGADGAPCNNTLSMFSEMRLAALLQKPIHGPSSMDAKTVFKLATIKGAEALHLDKEAGSIEIGKKADLAILDLKTPLLGLGGNDDAIYGNIVYAATAGSVTDVMINGRWVVRDRVHTGYNGNELFHKGKEQLGALLKRAEISV
jgi:cytosine/adenosine deaminase-related metal-dependent hydrolase